MLLIGLGSNLRAQTYSVGGPAAAQQKAKPGKAAPAPAAGQSLGFGSNIENARLARAAELALKQHEYVKALDFAQRAARAAPNDPNLWFLLGYAARLNGKGQQSVDAYSHGLNLNPASLDGQSGLAQSYRMMGRNDDAIALLKKVVAADSRRTDDQISLGELYIKAR